MKKDALKAKKARDRNDMKTLRKNEAKQNRKAMQAEKKLAKQCEKEAQKLLKQQQKASRTRKENHDVPKRVRDEFSISSSDDEALSDSVAIPSKKKKLAAPMPKPAKSTPRPSAPSSDDEALSDSVAIPSKKKKLAAPMPKPAESVFSEYDSATNMMCKWKM